MPSTLSAAAPHRTAATAHGAFPHSSVLLQHTFNGTKRVLYSDGYVETLTLSDAVSNSASALAAAAATTGGLPTIIPISSSSHKERRHRKGRKGEGAAGAATPGTSVSVSASASAAPAYSAFNNHGISSQSRRLTPSGTMEVPRSRHGKDVPPFALESYEAAAQVYRPPHRDSRCPSFSKSSDACKVAVPTVMHNDTPPSPYLREAWTPYQARAEVMQLYPTAAAAAAADPSCANGSSSVAPASSSFAATTATHVSTFEPRGSADARQTAGASRDSNQPASLGLLLRQQQSPDGERAGANASKSGEEAGNSLFLTFVPTEALRPSSVPPTAPALRTLLEDIQQELRSEFSSDQRARVESFASRCERDVQDSPSVFSLLFPFRPLEEIYRENAQVSAASVEQAERQRSPSISSRGEANPAPHITAAVGGIPDVLLPSAQTTTPMGWTIPELIQERLQPRETPALQHRFRELLALRGILDAPGTMTCRFFMTFTWFVLLRCRKAHWEQMLVDGYRRLIKAFTDVFPLSSRDTVPTLDVLGQLLVELLTCVRHEDMIARETEQQQGRQQKHDARSSTSSWAKQSVVAGLGSTSLDSRSGSAHRNRPHYANLSDLLSIKDLFPLLTGEWSHLLRHASTTPNSTPTPPALPPYASGSHNNQHLLMDSPGNEYTQRKLSILPSAKALQVLLNVYQELWLLHSKYVEICLYEEELYKQLAILFRNFCVQVAHAAAGSSTPDNTASMVSGTTTPNQRKAKASNALSTNVEGGEDSDQPSSIIPINIAQVAAAGPLAAASAVSSAAKDSILDSLLMAVAHTTYFICVFCFPNDVYAGIFDEEFRTDVVQWLSYCCNGVVTTHAQTKHWPVPVQADYDAAQQLKEAAERRELAALGLQRSPPDDRRPSIPFLASSMESAQTEMSPSAGRRSQGEDGAGWTSGAAETGRKRRTVMQPAQLPVPIAAAVNTQMRAYNRKNTSSALESLKEESLDLENIVANAEYRLAHQFERYSRTAAQHVSELARRMARLQRWHKQAMSNSGGHGGSQRRLQRGSLVSRRGSCFTGFARTNTAAIKFDLKEEELLGTSMHSFNSPSSRLASFRKLAAQPLAISAKTHSEPRKAPKAPSEKKKKKNISNDSSEAKNAAPAFHPLSVSAASLPATTPDVDASISSSSVAAAQNKKSKRKPNCIVSSTNNTSSDSNCISWRSAEAEPRTPVSPQAPTDMRFSHRRLSCSLKVTSAQRGLPGSGAGKGGGGGVQPRGGDVRDLYRTSALVKNGKSLVTLAAELNDSALYSTAATDSLSKQRPDSGRGGENAAEKHSGTFNNLSREENDQDTSGVGVDGTKAQSHLSHMSPTSSTPIVSLLSSYPLCTCPAPITEYWLAMSLRVSSWWFPSSAASGGESNFCLYASPAAAALNNEDVAREGNTESTEGAEGQEPQRSPHAPLYLLAHEPWRGLYGRIVTIPPISSAARRAAKLIDVLAESLPYQQSLVYQALRVQELRHEQCCMDAASKISRRYTNDFSGSLPSSQRQPLVDGMMDTPNSVASEAAIAAAAVLRQSNLGTATISVFPPLVSGLDSLSAVSQAAMTSSVASYLRRRGVGETYQGCTSPFFRLYASICITLTLSSEELSLLRESLNSSRNKRREDALLSRSLRDDQRHHLSKHQGNAAAAPSVPAAPSRVPAPSQDIHGQQVLFSLLPLSPPSSIAAQVLPLARDRQAAQNSPEAASFSRVPASRKSESAQSVRKSLRILGVPGAATNVFAVTAVPREEAKLRPCRLRPLQEEALMRRTQLLADMEIIDKRNGVARQNYVVQQLRLANTMAHLQTDTMLRRYRARSRLALERLKVDEMEGGNVAVREVVERRDD
ncbi:hypothetical protein ABL78_0234 [Leptomonas seymouri]|uniref:Uncharacterized protein n=1 Tax=Leptomonas seymouri TaxID=5684 RepID=A0A0N1I2A0_LEPSE|nr:hypothetical protein ABL78_0234 [Leptomonas seymouri]|eukprot:KPI90638.1 hypothetical protein ABL78_0234 [Leptomonas seymouri]